MSAFSQSLHRQLFSTIFAVISWTVLALMAWVTIMIMIAKSFPWGITVNFIYLALGFSLLSFNGWYARIKGKAPIHAFVRNCLGVE